MLTLRQTRQVHCMCVYTVRVWKSGGSLKKCRRSCGGCGVSGLNCAIHSVRVWLSLFLCCLRCDLHADNCYVTVKATRNVPQPRSSLKMDGVPCSTQCGGITGSPSVESHVFRFRRWTRAYFSVQWDTKCAVITWTRAIIKCCLCSDKKPGKITHCVIFPGFYHRTNWHT